MQANKRAEDGRLKAETAQEEARASARAAANDFEVAYHALDTLITTTQKQMADRPGLLEVKRQFLESAVAGLKRLVHPQDEFRRVDRLVVAAHERLGDLYFDLGRTAESAAEYEESLRSAEAWVGREPDDVTANLAVAHAHDKLGTQASNRRDFAAAESHFQKAVRIRYDLAKRFPEDENIRREWSTSLHKLGDIAFAAFQFQKARENYAESLRIFESLAPQPSPSEIWSGLCFRNSRLSDVCLEMDDLPAADRYAQSSISAARHLRYADPRAGQRELSIGLERAAMTAVYQHRYQDAIQLRREVLKWRRDILASDPGNKEAERNVYVALAYLGLSLTSTQDFAAAREAFNERKTLCEAASAADPGSVQKGADVVACYHDFAILEECERRYNEAAACSEKCAELCRQAENNPKAAYLQPGFWRQRYERDRDLYLAAARLGLDEPVQFSTEPPPLRPGLWRLRTAALAQGGEWDKAVASAQELLRLARTDSDALLAGARAYAALVALHPDPARCERHGAAAVEALSQNISLRPASRFELTLNPVFVTLRGRPDFRKLLGN